MSNHLLSQNADKALNIIYQEYLSHKNNHSSKNSYHKLFEINSLFPNSNDNDVMPSLIELSTKRIIRLFSDKRFMINDRAISYIEKHFKKGTIS